MPNERKLKELTQNLENVYGRQNEINNLMQALGFDRKELLRNFENTMWQRRFAEKQKEFEMAKQMGNTRLSYLPTTADILFQSGLQGLTTGITTGMENRRMEEYLQGLETYYNQNQYQFDPNQWQMPFNFTPKSYG